MQIITRNNRRENIEISCGPDTTKKNFPRRIKILAAVQTTPVGTAVTTVTVETAVTTIIVGTLVTTIFVGTTFPTIIWGTKITLAVFPTTFVGTDFTTNVVGTTVHINSLKMGQLAQAIGVPVNWHPGS